MDGVTSRRDNVRRWIGTAPVVLFFLAPLAASLVLLLPELAKPAAFAGVLRHPQFGGALALTLFTGVAATGLALFLAILVVANLGAHSSLHAGTLLSVPHVAFAIGLGFLIAPTGLLSRLIATLFTGNMSPPSWQTTQDPFGLALVLALVLKEVPFLVWAMISALNQDELRQRLHDETRVAQSLGHSTRSAFLRVVLPQVLQRLRWPLVAVFAYGMTVVDMALVIGPTQPPTLAQLVWTDLNDGEAENNARGAAGTLLLTLVACLCLAVVAAALRAARPVVSRWLTGAASRPAKATHLGGLVWTFFLLVYALVLATLLLQSVSLRWPFPHLFASHWTLSQWERVLADPSPVTTSLALAFISATTGLVSVVVWLESQPQHRDRFIFLGVLLALCLPGLLLALGHYRLLLVLGWTGTGQGLLLVHLIAVVAYMFVLLQGPYRKYDVRWKAVSQGAGAGQLRFLFRVKWPMLKAPLSAAWAVGFAVSLAQFVSAQLAAAGRFSTLPMEAVTLTSGGNRALIAVHGMLLFLLPWAGFVAAGLFGRPRWKTR